MNKQQLQIVSEAKKVVTDIFQTKVNPLFVFHNLEHTIQVAIAAEEIEGYYQLNNDDRFVLFVSAWFHDTGFSSGHAEEHEKESIKLAKEFLAARTTDEEMIMRITSCIQATHMPQEPQNLVEKIICDADLFHLGTNMFRERGQLLRKELQAYYKCDFTEEEWRQLNIDFLKSHNYFTGYCRAELEPVKQEWIEKLQNKQETSVK
jgi:predicted metal-dependent HD superfamily phosphohydrolase